MQQLTPNTLLQGGKYKIEKVLGQGGFGITYLAEQVMLGRKVAIKEFFMKELCNRDSDTSHVSVGSVGSVEMVDRFKEKFLKEARMIAGMDNSHIVRIHDIFEENGTAYYVMENIDGGSADDKVKNRPLNEAEAIRIIKEIGSALAYIHKQNVLHLDVKPSNILLRPNGDAVLIDFGISKRYDVEGGQTSTTPTGISKGYAPIEQYNQGLQNFSPATDVYSLGATLYKFLTGKTPPEAPVLLDDEDFPSCPYTVSSELWNAIEKAMEPRRKKRYQSVGDFLSAISVNNVKSASSAKKTSEETVIVSDITPKSSVSPGVQSNINPDETVIIKEKQINSNGHEFVDLGLSVKWARCNIGANSEYEKGSTFPFANTDYPNYLPSVISGNKQYDHCFKAWGGDWRLPTKEEQDELRQKCKWDYIASQNYYKVTGPNGNSIILPITNNVMGLGSVMWPVGCYWSGSFHVTNRNTAYYLYIDNGRNMISWMNEDIKSKFAVRGVIE